MGVELPFEAIVGMVARQAATAVTLIAEFMEGWSGIPESRKPEPQSREEQTSLVSTLEEPKE